MGNGTSIDLSNALKSNSSNGTNSSSSGGPSLSFLPPGRPQQELDAVDTQAFTALFLQVFIIILNIMMITVSGLRLKSISYIILQSVFVLDLMTAFLAGVVWTFALQLDTLPWQMFMMPLCLTQGFVNSFFVSGFLHSITLTSLSQCLLVGAPGMYNTLFKSGAMARIVLLVAMMFSAFLAAFPLFSEWGKYGMYEHSNCWMMWKATNYVIMSFNLFTTLLWLVPAVVITVLANMIIFMKPKDPNNQTSSSPQPEVVIIATIQLIIFLILWLGLTILNAEWIEDWHDVDYVTILVFFFFYYARGLWNPIVCFAVSKNVRNAFVEVIFKCKCRHSRRVEPLQGEQELQGPIDQTKTA